MLLALVLQAVVTVTSRLLPGAGGWYGAPAQVGQVSGLVGLSSRPGLVSFEPGVLLANLAVTAALILPILPLGRPWGTAGAAALGAAIAYALWLLSFVLPLGGFEAIASSAFPVRTTGLFHPVALWAGLLGSMFAAAYLWRRRGSEQVTWTYGNAVVTRAVAALTVGLLLQTLVVSLSILEPAGDRSYGAPIAVGTSSGLGGGMIGGGSATFEPSLFLVDVVLTAALVLQAIPATRAWTVGIAAVVATVVGFLAFFGTMFLGTTIGFVGVPIPMPVTTRALPWFLWANLLLWALAGALLWRRRAPRAVIGGSEPVLH